MPHVLTPRIRILLFLALVATHFAGHPSAQAPATAPAAPRPMTFLDMQQMRNAGAPTPSPDGRWMLYTVSTPDWQKPDGRRTSTSCR